MEEDDGWSNKEENIQELWGAIPLPHPVLNSNIWVLYPLST
jgi:hypothetical protein